MSVGGREQPASETLKLGERHGNLDQPLAEPAAPERLEHEHVGEIREGGVVRDDAGEPDLPGGTIEPEDERMREGA